MSVRKKYAVDLGSSNSRLWEGERGIIFDEPSILAVSAMDGSLTSLGNEAKEMLGKAPESLTSMFPVSGGVITNEEAAVTLLKNILRRSMPRFQAFGPDVMSTVTSGATQVEKQALLRSLLQSGASHAYLVDISLASAIGAGIPVAGASGHMVVNFGSDTTESAVLSLGGVVYSNSVRIGSSAIDKAIASYIKNEYGLVIGSIVAEQIKINIASANPSNQKKELDVSGRDLIYGLPRTITLNAEEIFKAISPILFEIIAPVKTVLENIPPELASDVIEKGIIMTGGGSNLRMLDRFLTSETGIPSHVAEEPSLSAVRGAGIILENIELWKRSLLTK